MNHTAPAPLLAVRLRDAARMIGIGRTKVYDLIGSSELQTVKIGRATLITMSSLRRLVDG